LPCVQGLSCCHSARKHTHTHTERERNARAHTHSLTHSLNTHMHACSGTITMAGALLFSTSPAFPTRILLPRHSHVEVCDTHESTHTRTHPHPKAHIHASRLSVIMRCCRVRMGAWRGKRDKRAQIDVGAQGGQPGGRESGENGRADRATRTCSAPMTGVAVRSTAIAGCAVHRQRGPASLDTPAARSAGARMQGAAARPGLSVARGAGANVDAAGRAASTHSASTHGLNIADRVEGIRRSFYKYKILYSYTNLYGL